MIDINTIISQALAAAVQQATAPLLERIAALEAQSANRHERLLVLENNPAQGVDTTLEEAAANKDKHERQLFVLQHLTARVTALEKHTAVLDQHGGIIEYLDNQEWFWDKIRNFTDTAVEQAVEQHCEDYDHDDMVMKHELPDMDDYIKREDFDSEVRDAVRDTLEDARIHLRF